MRPRRFPETTPTGLAPPTDLPREAPPSVRMARAAPDPHAAGVPLTPESRHALIAQNAYLRAERRGFESGHDVEDWLAAEAEVDALLKTRRKGASQ